MMKKIVLFIASVLLIAGCTSNSMKEEERKDYYLTYNNYQIKVGNDFNTLLALVGPYNSVREEASSYSEGTAKVYNYNDFEVETYIENNIEKIYSIIVTSAQVETNEGIHLNSSKHEMTVAYGLDYNQPTEEIYTYSLSNSNITFIVENDIIIGIMYYLK